MTFPRLSPTLTDQLARVPKSHDGEFEYAPCRVTLVDGTVLDNVYVQEATMYLNLWGDDPSRPAVSAAEVVSIEDSPVRLPFALADKLYAAGESGMGYVKFVVELRDGGKIPFLTGNAVDFPDWPIGVGPADVADVAPHAGGAGSVPRTSTRYSWCLYRAPEAL